MINDRAHSLRSGPKSERVVELLATCIRAAVSFRYAHQLSKPDSVDLARVHDLRSALKNIAEKMEVHENLPSSPMRFTLAVAETKLMSEANLGIDKIVDIREAAAATLSSRLGNMSDLQSATLALRAAQQETRLWATAYTRFVVEIQSLYKSTSIQIGNLHLPTHRLVKAHSDLEKLLLDAIGRAGKV